MLEEMVHRVEARLFDLLRDREAERAAELECLETEIARLRAELRRVVERRQHLRRLLADHEITAALLPGQIESSARRDKIAQAFRQSLELERVRRETAAARAELPGLEQTCWSLSFRLRQQQRTLARLVSAR